MIACRPLGGNCNNDASELYSLRQAQGIHSSGIKKPARWTGPPPLPLQQGRPEFEKLSANNPRETCAITTINLFFTWLGARPAP